MKKISISFLILTYIYCSYAQQTVEGVSNTSSLNITNMSTDSNDFFRETEGISSTPSFSITKEIKPPILSISNLVFSDANNNRAIDASESASISFDIENNGMGDGFGLILKTNAAGSTQGLEFDRSLSIPVVQLGKKLRVHIPITSDMSTLDGKVLFTLKVDEPNGFGTDEHQIEISTRSFVAPLLEVVDYTITSDVGGLLIRRAPFDLQILIQNTKHGEAEDIQVNIILPNGVLLLTGNEMLQYSRMKAGEQVSIIYKLIVSDIFKEDVIPLRIAISEKHNRFAKNKELTLSLNQQMASRKIEIEAEKSTEKTEVVRASLVSTVDRNIPRTGVVHKQRYALIIGNEDYATRQPFLTKESNVDYAVNDATIFREYCIHTLGVPENQIFFLTNATKVEMSRELERLSLLSQNERGKAELIFYYAGHGMPDENTKEPYLIPVDVSGANVSNGLKLMDLYTTLTKYPAQRITVFIDACFSGDARNVPLLAQRLVRINPDLPVIKGNLVVFTSSEGIESSGPFHKEQHGYFTFFLLKKLQESKGDITYKDLYDYIDKEVRRESLLSGKPQSPQLLVTPDLSNLWQNWKMR